MCIYRPLPHLFLTADLDFLVVVVHLVDGYDVVDLSFKLNSETNGSQSLGLFTGSDRKSYGFVFVVHFAFGLIDCISVGVNLKLRNDSPYSGTVDRFIVNIRANINTSSLCASAQGSYKLTVLSEKKAHRSYYSDELLILFSTRCFSSPIRFVFQPSTFQKKQKRAHSTAVEKENRSGNKEKQELSLLGGHTLPYRRANSHLIRSYSTTPPSIKNIEEKGKEVEWRMSETTCFGCFFVLLWAKIG